MNSTTTPKGATSMIRFGLILLLSMLVGFLSLCQELLWFRILSFSTGSLPYVFGYLLGFFLLGVALGALQAQRTLKQQNIAPYAYIAWMLAVSGLIYYASLPLIAHAYTLLGEPALYVALFLIAVVSYCVGSVFPVLCHLGASEERTVGISVSWIYLANIIGATAGPLLTGFVLMDLFTLEQLNLMTSIFSLALAAIIYLSQPTHRQKPLAILALSTLTIGMLLFHQPLYNRVLARLLYKKSFAKHKPFRYTLQNRSGIITIRPAWGRKDVLYGHGMYDGRFNADPRTNVNGIDRCYHIANLRTRLDRVLFIGLGSASWARAVAYHRGVKEMVAVEINPGYKTLIRHYPQIYSVMKDKRMHYYTDDGRRWLVRHPKEKFDLILTNTTFHWRSNSTNLLSVEFYRLLKKHLNPGGMVYFNTTYLYDIHYTLAQVFKHITRYGSFVAASDRPFRLTQAQRAANLQQFYRNGRQLFPKGSRLMRKMLALQPREYGDDYRNRPHQYMLITDDNMSNEYKHNHKLRWRLNPRRTWWALWKKLSR